MRTITSILAAGAALLAASATQAQSVKSGELRCQASGAVGAVVASRQTLDCTLAPTQGGPALRYSGTITKVGVAIGEIKAGEMRWLVYSPNLSGPADIQGAFVGVTADVAVGRGLGANVLVGGDRNGVALQPVSVEANQGVNVAAGIAELELRRAQ